jgi:hypothetical protein
MKKRLSALLVCLAALAAISGCDAILEDDTLVVTAHEKPTSASPDSETVVSTFAQLKEQALGFIMQREEVGYLRVNSYEGSIETDVKRVCSEIMKDDPYGAYAVLNMQGQANNIVSYWQVEINITYKSGVTKEQLDDIIPVSAPRYLESILQDRLENYAPSLTVLAKNLDLSQSEALDMINRIYYENPMVIVMLPLTSPPEFYPDHGPDRIIQFTFDYSKESTTLTAMEDALKNKVLQLAAKASGAKDSDTLLSLCELLMDITKFDSATAGSGDYSTQNIAATAYGALIAGSAVGEGYAMAYKALCDELGIESYVVLGTLGGERHAWNIVNVDGWYYHIDVSMCDVNGIETAFLKSDAEMKKTYSWDTGKYKPCNGSLTYNDIAGGDETPSAGTESPSPGSEHHTST